MNASAQKFAEYYHGLADEELLNLALQRHELLEAAASALDAEMASRSLGENELREFRERRHAETLDDREVQPGDASIEPPATTELPSDWFDEEDKSSAASHNYAPTRPKAATVLALLFWLGGAMGISLGVVLVSGGIASSSRLLVVSGVLEVIFGAFSSVAGFGLWRVSSWGRTCALLLCWVDVGLQSANIACFAYIRMRGFAIDPLYVLPHFGAFLRSFGFAIYFGGENAQRIFCRSSQSAIGETQAG